MASKEELLAHAYANGWLPKDRAELYEHAVRSGFVKAAPETKALVQNRTSPLGQAAGFMANVNRGLGVGDEMAAGIKTAKDSIGDLAHGRVPNVPGRFQEAMRFQRGLEDSFKAGHPHAAALGQGTGMALTAAVPGGAGGRVLVNASRAGNAARGAVTALGGAATYAAVDRGSAGDRLRAASGAARNPLVAALGAGAGALAPAARMGVRPQRPSLDALRAQKTAAYAAADQVGARYAPHAFSQLAADLSSDLHRANINPMRHPRAASMLADIEQMARDGHSPSLTQIDQLRQVVRRDVVDTNDRAERFMGRRIMAGIDRFVNTSGPQHMASGSGAQAAQLIGRARELNTRFVKVEGATEALERARRRTASTGSGGNINNATRQEVRKWQDRTTNLTPDERVAANRVVEGDRTQNALRLVGKLSPGGNGLIAALELGGAAMKGPLALAAPAAGFAAKHVADRVIRQRVEGLLTLMASGGHQGQVAQRQLQLLAANDPGVAVLTRNLNRLGRTAGIAGQSRNALAASN